MRKITLLLILCVLAIGLYYFARQKEEAVGPTPAPTWQGVNLGYWLSDEFAYDGKRFDCDAPRVSELLRQQFGITEAERLLNIHRDQFIVASDFAAIAAAGFRVVRIPVDALHMYDRPGDNARFENISRRISWALEQAATNRLEVILNIRIRPGEWALQPPVGGKRFPARWSERDVTAAADLWRKLASRFKDSTTLVGYDLSPGTCQAPANWTKAFRDWTATIKAEDATKTIYAPWPRPMRDAMYGDPLFDGLTVGYAAVLNRNSNTESGVDNEADQMLAMDIPNMNQYWASAGIPVVAVEFDAVIKPGADHERSGAFLDTFQRNHWSSIWWTYKEMIPAEKTEHESAAILVGKYETDFPDLSVVSVEDVDRYFEEIGRTSYETNNAVVAVLASRMDAPSQPKKEKSSPDKKADWDTPSGWSVLGVGGVDFTVKSTQSGGFVATSSGLGVLGFEKEFGYIHQEIDHHFDMRMMVESVSMSSDDAGAGLMIRQSLDADSPYLAIYKDASGRVVAVADNMKGQPALRRFISTQSGIKYLRLIGEGIVIKASCSTDGLTWPVAANFTLPWATNRVLAGATLFSGHEYRVSSMIVNDLTLNNLSSETKP